MPTPVRSVLRHTAATLRGRDIALWAAGLTFFACLAIVPLLLLGLRGAAALLGHAVVVDGAAALAAALPDEQRAGSAVAAITDAALRAPWPVLAVALIPATFYGEGLRRALDQPAGQAATGTTGWRGRLGFLPVLAAAPVLLAAPLALAPAIGSLYSAGGWSLALGVVASFHLDWVLISVALSLVFTVTAPNALPGRTAVAGAFATGAFLTGFLHGFLLFLAIPVDWSVPFAGLAPVGVAAAVALWLYLLHVVLILGYRTTLSAHQAQQPPVRSAYRRSA
ncbi:YihY/virulence factor BrkB family protein [Actinokineospora sp. UTMC 2448]|uniref:YihY/virulence factor BrkB family protein n=1 Tax=Actinokineospora sp. UTMC 2448 TaxID=2268449 RepID=UPI002164E0A6|nr:YihY/virulence factor BrkB family protein [Actinokineospora sp. UTMC 2448]UVS78475.1 Ribonuclease BN-like family protein [Actinokineospora sp. UTMC 2448]